MAANRAEQSAERVRRSHYKAIRYPQSHIEAYENYRYWTLRSLRENDVPKATMLRAIRMLQSHLDEARRGAR